MTRERGEQAVSEDERETLAQLAKAATPGPWKRGGADVQGDEYVIDVDFADVQAAKSAVAVFTGILRSPNAADEWPANLYETQAGADAAFIAAANPDTIRRLLAEIARLKDENSRLWDNVQNLPSKDEIEANQRADAAEARVQVLLGALRKVRMHTSYLPGAPIELLRDLLASVERVTDAALASSQGAGE